MTQSATWFLDVGEKIFAGLGPQTQAFVTGFLEDRSDLEGPDLTFIQLARGLDPEALSPQHIIERAPYGNPSIASEEMDAAAGRGWLERAGESQYVLSAEGDELATEFAAQADEIIGGLAPETDVDLEQIVLLLQRVVKKARELPEPDQKPALSMGALFSRDQTSPLMVRLRRTMLDLFAFRDDVHVAAWQPYDVAGHAWEALTFVWHGEAGTAAELAEKLPYRHYDETTYAAALQDLAARGWIAEEDGRWVITQAGSDLRQEAEDATNRYFDAAWTALDEAEVDELRTLLERLAEAMTPPQ